MTFPYDRFSQTDTSGRRKCFRCSGVRVLEVQIPVGEGKDLDFHWGVKISMTHEDGMKKVLEGPNVPPDINLGGYGLCNFLFCLTCGQMQGKFPIGKTELDANDFCNTCNGSGEQPSKIPFYAMGSCHKVLCKDCKGSGKESSKEKITVNIGIMEEIMKAAEQDMKMKDAAIR